MNAKTIIEKSVDALVPYENNPRDNDNAVPYVAKSIERFGFQTPILIDKDNVIIAGHTRLLAAKSLGMDKVPCIIVDSLTEEEINAFRLADNKVAEVSEWNFDKLDKELAGLSLDMSDFGFADNTTDIQWASGASWDDDVEELTEDTYQQPKKTALKCPQCGHTAGPSFFKKVELQ